MISLDAARACVAALALQRDCTIVEPDDARPVLAAIEAGLALIPGAAPLLAQARALAGDLPSRVSVTLPLPGRTLILLSPAAVRDGAAYLSTAAHELVHGAQASSLGVVQVAADYLNEELRALREGEAGGVGLWARHVVTGEVPSPDDAGVVRSSLYHLDAHRRAFGRAVVESSLATIDTGAVPPHSVARAALEWLREHEPEAIAAEAYATRPTVTP